MAEECDVADTRTVKDKQKSKEFLCGVVEGNISCILLYNFRCSKILLIIFFFK